MQISSIRATYQSALFRAQQARTIPTQSTHQSLRDAEDGARSDVGPSGSLGGVEAAGTNPSQPQRSSRSTGYSGQRLPSIDHRMYRRGIAHLAGMSQADEARVHQRMRQLNQLLHTMNRLQTNAAQLNPLVA